MGVRERRPRVPLTLVLSRRSRWGAIPDDPNILQLRVRRLCPEAAKKLADALEVRSRTYAGPLASSFDILPEVLVQSLPGGLAMDAALKQEFREWAAEDDRLYDQFAARLETTHRGQYVAIGRTGEVLVGPDDIAVLDQALIKFGRGNFAFRRIGERTLGRWRSEGD